MAKATWLSLLAVLALTSVVRAADFLKPTQTIALPGVSGRFDHLAVDVARQRLFVAALGNNTIEVVDLKTGKRLQSLGVCVKPQGLLFLPKPNLLFATSGGDGKLKIYDCDSFRVIKTVGGLPDADNIRYDAAANRIYVGYGKGALAVVNAVSGVHTRDIKLEGHPESFQLEPDGVSIFINVPEAHHVAVISRTSRAVVAAWPLAKRDANFPMALDAASGQLFVGCRQPPKLVVLDTTSGKQVSDLDISGDTDDLFYDAKRKRLYLSCGEGFVNVVGRAETNQFKLLEKIPTAPGARTSLFVADLDAYCVPVPQRANQSAEIRVFQVRP
jgi:DNA-binding beta-propeller fold protein YncE